MEQAGSIDLVQQLRAHLESLQAAGVLFVPFDASAPLQVATNLGAQTNGAIAEVVETPPEDPIEVRQRELAVLREEVAKCDKCSELFSTRTQTVFGSGPLDAEVGFVGEAPGSAEDAQGEPFVGKGGQLLGRIIAACGFTRDHVYLFNIIKCRPPANRAPSMTECGNCRDFFRRQFELVKPKFLVALGSTASRLLTGQNQPLAKLRGKVYEYRGVPLVCTHHPDEIEKDASGARKREAWEDMKLLLRTMGREVPAPKS
ncbi:MAG: uracil-DNA glycosylase [Planctomycetia bacterium]|nr:uracil-DNA glycosylase [Planctomycetia bacterium]